MFNNTSLENDATQFSAAYYEHYRFVKLFFNVQLQLLSCRYRLQSKNDHLTRDFQSFMLSLV